MAFRFDKLTLKAQEAVTAAIAGWRFGQSAYRSAASVGRLLAEKDGIVGPILDKIGVNRGATG